jgi:hypothetical protein
MLSLGLMILVWGFLGLISLALLIMLFSGGSGRPNRPLTGAERTERLKARLRERKIDRIRLTDRLKEWEAYNLRLAELGDDWEAYRQAAEWYRPSHTASCRYLDNGDCDCSEYATRDYLDHVDEKIAIIEDELKPKRERKGLLAGRPDSVWDSSTINRHSDASRKRYAEFQRQPEAYWDKRIAESDQQRGNAN